MPTAPSSSPEFIDLLRRSGVVAANRLDEIAKLSLPDDPQKAAAELVSKRFITRFQAMQLLAGRHKGFRVGSYAILDLLGRGGMGAVYLAEHLELHRKVAIKVLVPGKDDDQKLAIERFFQEARAAAALDHPNIVRIFDVTRHNDVPYLVMEYVEGETLQQVLEREGSIPYPTATEYIAQAAAGLQHAYEKGFVHRDIKPGNLMRDRTGLVKILDMGLARSTATLNAQIEQLEKGAVVGTADFIAPEQGINHPDMDIRADIYSLGATYFTLIIGKPPFEGNTTQKLLQHQLKSAPSLATLDATLPKGISAVVAKMLSKRPEDRYQTPAEVIAALSPWMGSSARIIAGLSRTNLAQSADLHATLSDIVRGGSSPRFGRDSSTITTHPGDPSVVDPFEVSQETGSVAGANTTRESRRRSRFATPGKGNRKRLLLFAVLGLAVLASGGLVGWLAFGAGKPPAPAPPPTEGIVYSLDVANNPKFRVVKQQFTVKDGGPELLPPGIGCQCRAEGAIAEFQGAIQNGSPALGVSNLVTGTIAEGSGQFFFQLEGDMRVLLQHGKAYRVTIGYMTKDDTTGKVLMQATPGYKEITSANLPSTGGEWKSASVSFVRPPDDKIEVRMVIENTSGAEGNALWVRSLEIVEMVPAKR